MSMFGTIEGGYGYTTGFGMPAVQLDYEKSKGADDAPKPQEATKRPYISPLGQRGQWPGFGAFPVALTIPLCWAMRRYPTTKKVHSLLTAPLKAGSRSIEVIDDGGNTQEAEDIKKAAGVDLLPMLEKAMPGAMEAPHFGYWLQEIVWDTINKRTAPVDMRSILPGQAILHVDDERQFTGYQLASIGNAWRDARYAFLCVNDPHIDPILGYSFNENALATWFRATKSNENADAVERKAAGIQLILHIMQGVMLTDSNGNEVDAATFATQWMNAAVKGESVVVPAMAFKKEAIENNPELADVPVVKADTLEWGDTGPALTAHLTRLRGLDVDIFSAWGVPERAGMESQHGSRADAEAHGSVVLSISEHLHTSACNQWDAQVTSRWMKANYAGSSVKIKTVPSPLSDPQQTFLQELVVALATNQQAATEIIANLNKRKLLERVEAPVVSEEDAKKAIAEAEQKQQDAQAAANEAKSKQPMGGRFAEQGGNGNGNGKAAMK
jgi:hypothetical protein